MSRLDEMIAELEDTATRLRAGELDAAQAAQLVERCAEIAGRLGAELDRAAREAEAEEPAQGQERLL